MDIRRYELPCEELFGVEVERERREQFERLKQEIIAQTEARRDKIIGLGLADAPEGLSLQVRIKGATLGCTFVGLDETGRVWVRGIEPFSSPNLRLCCPEHVLKVG